MSKHTMITTENLQRSIVDRNRPDQRDVYEGGLLRLPTFAE